MVNLQERLQDVERFKEALLASEVGPQVLKIYLFGSLARGTSNRDSDIDLFVVLRRGGRGVEDIANTTLMLQLQGCGPLEPMTSSVEDLFAPGDYFVHAVTHRGKEIYSVPDEDVKREGARAFRDLAEQYLDAAEDTMERGHLRLGLDGAYNAGELAVKGLLLLTGVDEIPGSHGGLVQAFGERLVKPGQIEREVGRKLNQALQWRNWARYRLDAPLSEQHGSAVIDLAKRLISQLSERLA